MKDMMEQGKGKGRTLILRFPGFRVWERCRRKIEVGA